MRMSPVNYVCYTVTVPKLLPEGLVRTDWMSSGLVSKSRDCEVQRTRKLTSSARLCWTYAWKNLRTLCAQNLHELSSSVPLGTNITYKFVKRIFPPKER